MMLCFQQRNSKWAGAWLAQALASNAGPCFAMSCALARASALLRVEVMQQHLAQVPRA